MKTIIAGSRTATQEETYMVIQESGFADQITQVISGGAKGADYWGEQWAKEHGLPLRRIDAEWTKYGKAAGPIRNRQMAECAEALIAVWIDESRGTASMIDLAYQHNLLVSFTRISR